MKAKDKEATHELTGLRDRLQRPAAFAGYTDQPIPASNSSSAMSEASSALKRGVMMRALGKGLVAVAIAAAVVGSAIAFAQGNLSTLFSVTPAEMKFVSNTGRPGSGAAVLVGDPGKAGIYVMHGRIPANTKIEPHSHSEVWRVATILSGTLYYGYGDTFDEGKLKALVPGSVIVEPKDQPHFAMTKDESVTLQLVADGPTATNPVRK